MAINYQKKIRASSRKKAQVLTVPLQKVFKMIPSRWCPYESKRKLFKNLSINQFEKPPQMIQGNSHELQRLFDFLFVHVLSLSEFNCLTTADNILRNFSTNKIGYFQMFLNCQKSNCSDQTFSRENLAVWIDQPINDQRDRVGVRLSFFHQACGWEFSYFTMMQLWYKLYFRGHS